MSAELDQKSMMLGGHEARLDALELGQKNMAEDVKKILSFVEQRKGSWKTLAAFGGGLVGLVEIIEALKAVFIHKT
jgi:hypothetical protein